MDTVWVVLAFIAMLIGLFLLAVSVYQLLFPERVKKYLKEFEQKKLEEKELNDSEEIAVAHHDTDETVELIDIESDWLRKARQADALGNEAYARIAYQKVAYSSASLNKQQQHQLKQEITHFVKKDSMYKKWLIPFKEAVKNNEGILQSKLYAKLGVTDESDKEAVRYIAYFAGELGDIVRLKKGRSYQLFSSKDKIVKELSPKNPQSRGG